MKIDKFIDEMEELIEISSNIPFTGGKKVVDIDKLHDLIENMRDSIPREIVEAKIIMQDKKQIISGANKEAIAILRRAEEQARKLVSKEEIVVKAKAEAQNIERQQAKAAKNIHDKMMKYCDNLLSQTEDLMNKNNAEISVLRKNLNIKPDK